MKRLTPMAWAAGAILATVPLAMLIASRRPATASRGKASRAPDRARSPATQDGAMGAGLSRTRQRWFFDAPRERVYAYWTAFESFPDFLDGVDAVRDLGEGRFSFDLRSPGGGGAPGGGAAWEARLVRAIPGSELAWESEPDSAVQCRGSVRFLSEEGGGTVVELEAEYGPGSAWLAEGMRRFLGRDLPVLLSNDILRMKDLIETGSAYL